LAPCQPSTAARCVGSSARSPVGPPAPRSQVVIQMGVDGWWHVPGGWMGGGALGLGVYSSGVCGACSLIPSSGCGTGALFSKGDPTHCPARAPLASLGARHVCMHVCGVGGGTRDARVVRMGSGAMTRVQARTARPSRLGCSPYNGGPFGPVTSPSLPTSLPIPGHRPQITVKGDAATVGACYLSTENTLASQVEVHQQLEARREEAMRRLRAGDGVDAGMWRGCGVCGVVAGMWGGCRYVGWLQVCGVGAGWMQGWVAGREVCAHATAHCTPVG
jgi:hypothetical protein